MKNNVYKAKSVFIVRHGETEWNTLGKYQGSLDSPLTPGGLRTVYALADKLKGENIQTLFTSPLARARKTGEIIGNTIDVDINVIPEFREMNFGIFEGKTKEIVRKDFSEFFTQRNKDKGCKVYTPFPQGESYRDVYKRVFDKVSHLLSNYESFIIVGHHGVNRVIRGVILNLPLEDIIDIRQRNNEYIKIDVPEQKEYSYLIRSSSKWCCL